MRRRGQKKVRKEANNEQQHNIEHVSPKIKHRAHGEAQGESHDSNECEPCRSRKPRDDYLAGYYDGLRSSIYNNCNSNVCCDRNCRNDCEQCMRHYRNCSRQCDYTCQRAHYYNNSYIGQAPRYYPCAQQTPHCQLPFNYVSNMYKPIPPVSAPAYLRRYPMSTSNCGPKLLTGIVR